MISAVEFLKPSPPHQQRHSPPHKLYPAHKPPIHSSAFSPSQLSEDATEQEVLNSVSGFNDDPPVHGILVQLPLPSHMDEQNIVNAVSIEKDVDGFHLLNIGCLAMRGREPCLFPVLQKSA
ncbi:hypothetical protein M0R45_002096 [Rubus argutus]|uniref:Tetrahydrofolate dehydrogenase/cyclohydrolase catalytic domain-containing protein n=1 Tax=Rubus argutus TaxID=59490 RepID=A0AAW1VE88_RUBAR